MTRRTAAFLTLLLFGFSGCRRNGRTRIVVGSKNFTEQIILAELLKQYLGSRTGLEVGSLVNLGGTLICHKAILAGEIDLFVEYTGTALTAVLEETPSGEPADVYRRVKAAYGDRFGLEVTEPLGFNNTFAIVIRGDDARRLKLKTISDAAQRVPAWRAGFGYEFMGRPDGFRGLERTYHLRLEGPPRTMELGLLYRALEEKQVDIVAGNSTDGAISALNLVVLEDDRHYFPPYDAVPVVRKRALQLDPELRPALHALGGKISDDEMRHLNYAVDGEHRDLRQTVSDFLRAKRL